MAKRVDAGTNTVTPAEFIRFSEELLTAQRNIAKATEALAQERGVKAGIFRRAKNAGADIEAMKHLAKLAELDVEDRNRLMENVSQYAAWTGVVLWRAGTEDQPQGGLFDNDPAAKAAAEAFQDAVEFANGLAAAKTGGSMDDNPHAGGTRMHQRWAAGFKDLEFDAAGPAKVETANTARKPAPKRGTVVPTGPVEVPKPRGRPAKQKALPAPDAIGEPQGTA